MTDKIKLIAQTLGIGEDQVRNAVKLHDEGATVPFIARYRKEMTGSLDENVLRDIFDQNQYFEELEERRQTVLDSIEKQEKLTPELKEKILNVTKKNELEDLYLPYKPKRRTRAVKAKERGLEPLAVIFKDNNTESSPEFNIQKEAYKFLNEEVETPEDAVKGACDIIAEEVAENADIRQWVRDFIYNTGQYTSKIKPEFEEGKTNYETYRDFSVPVRKIPPHTMLALRRGEKEKVLLLNIDFDEDKILGYINDKVIRTNFEPLLDLYKLTVKDAFKRLMKHSLTGEIRLQSKEFADEKSIEVFEANLRQILLAAPAGMRPTIAIDPGFRTGCKSVVLDSTGQYKENKTIFPFNSDAEKYDAQNFLENKTKEYKIELIAIGNGTAGRETERFVRDVFKGKDDAPVIVLVNEAGASVYSAGKVANEEFPDLDLTVRGAISIGRRLQDPLDELVKIEPKSIGVGQYQHDVDQKLLSKKLSETVESCVNHVGVDVNLASKTLLTYVSGISKTIAENVIKRRNAKGAFNAREELNSIPKFGDKTFEQAAGFLRIRNGKNVLDNTAVHPESYDIVEKFSADLNTSVKELTQNKELLNDLDLKNYTTEKIGLPTLKDIIFELEKPGRDPREEFKYAEFKEGVNEITDLKQSMELEGVVTNITNFGAFVDIGVHQDGLVHISEMANHFVKDPTKLLKVGQVVKVLVLDVDPELKRIQLSIKRLNKPGKKQPKKKQKSNFTMDDLKNKFNKV